MAAATPPFSLSSWLTVGENPTSSSLVSLLSIYRGNPSCVFSGHHHLHDAATPTIVAFFLRSFLHRCQAVTPLQSPPSPPLNPATPEAIPLVLDVLDWRVPSPPPLLAQGTQPPHHTHMRHHRATLGRQHHHRASLSPYLNTNDHQPSMVEPPPRQCSAVILPISVMSSLLAVCTEHSPCPLFGNARIRGGNSWAS